MATTLTPPLPTIRKDRAGAPPWGILAAATCVLLAQLPLLTVHAQQLWVRPHYQFFPFVLLGAVVLALARFKEIAPLTPGAPFRSYTLVAMAWLLLAGAELLYSSWLAAVAVLVVLLAFLYGLGGSRLVRLMLPAWALLWLAVPPPFGLDNLLIWSLQSLTTRWSSGVLDLLGVYHVMLGNVVEVGGRRLLVEEACAGVNSLFSVLACTLFFVLLVRRPLVRSLLLIVAAVAWVLVANVARVVGVAYLSSRSEIDLATGWRHDAFGLVLFTGALLLIWSTDRLLLFLAPARVRPPQPRDAAEGQASSAPAEPRSAWIGAWAIAVAYGTLAVGHVSLYGLEFLERAASGGTVSASVEQLQADSLPAQLAKAEQKAFATESRNTGSAYGEFSKSWTYQLGSHAGVFSVDYPFWTWHELTVCYVGQGWKVEDNLAHPGKPADGTTTEGFVEVRLSQPGGRSGHLFFCQLNDHGVVLEPPAHRNETSLQRHESALLRIWDRLHGRTPPARTASPGPVYQVQLFVESVAPLSPAERAEAEAAFLQGVRALRERWSPKTQAQAP
jgi:exosortase